jgi:hypothetical protein
MCVQCMVGAMTAVGAASGVRAYVASRGFRWMTPKRLKALTVALAVAALAVSATLVSGSSATPKQPPSSKPHTAER